MTPLRLSISALSATESQDSPPSVLKADRSILEGDVHTPGARLIRRVSSVMSVAGSAVVGGVVEHPSARRRRQVRGRAD